MRIRIKIRQRWVGRKQRRRQECRLMVGRGGWKRCSGDKGEDIALVRGKCV